MNCVVVLLFFGAFLPCFYLECKALKYHGYQDDRSSESTIIDSLHRHRLRRNVDGDPTICKTINCTEKINHKYYVSRTFINGQSYWRDIEQDPNTKVQTVLSDSFLRRNELKLSFKFPYYGHYLDRVVLTTGGFLYMDVHDTRLITDVQYLAPLMAYFSPQQHNDSKVLTLDDGSQLTVQWLKVYLHNATHVGPFTFQCTLHKDGRIWFAYKEIPINVSTIRPLKYHPVRVGISDAYVKFYRDPRRPIIYRLFYIYSQVNITKKSVVNGSAVEFEPQLGCVGAGSCTKCMERSEKTEFNCQWCPQTQRCSDGADRHRAEWDLKKCSANAIKESSNKRCVLAPKINVTVNPTDQRKFNVNPRDQRKVNVNPRDQRKVNVNPRDQRKVNVNPRDQRKSKGAIGAGAIVGICIVLVLVIGIAAWCVYAYRYPTSKSGLFLIDASRRPRELFKRSSDGGGRSGDAAPSDIKPQVL